MSHSLSRRGFVAMGTLAALGLAGCSGAGQRSAGDTTTNETQNGENQQMAGIKSDRSTEGGFIVYATNDLTATGLLSVYHALGFAPGMKVAVKLHMGEEGNENFLNPELLRPLVEEVGGTFVDTTVLYFARSTADGYRRVASEHGFTYAPVDILDEDGGTALPVSGDSHLESAEVGSHILGYDDVISVAHFKGHAMAGFGGTFKNLAIGLATQDAKRTVHGASFDTGAPFLERVAEFSKGVFDHFQGHMACINVLNRLSVDCDCDSGAAEPRMADIGILASLDPVALDQASSDQIYLSDDPHKDELIERMESRDAQHLLDYAQELGLGSKSYEIRMV